MTAEGDSLIDYGTSIRPTRRRLLIAMGISTCLIVMLLASFGSLFELALSTSKSGVQQAERLIVHIRQRESSAEPDPVVVEQPDRAVSPEALVPNDVSEPQPLIASVENPEPPVGPEEARDWHTIAVASVRESSLERALREDSRDLMWRQNYSVMFKADDEFVANDDEPAIPGFRFKPRIHVAGLGFSIGGCFIGIPLVGVPVEQRTVGVSLFVCTSDAG